MESKYVHRPAVAPDADPRMSEPEMPGPPVPPESPGLPERPVVPQRTAASDAEIERTNFVEVIERQIRAHPMYALAGGFILGIVLGVVLRR